MLLTNELNSYFIGNSYIWLNWGYLSAPAGVYFSGDFSVSVWIYVINFSVWERIIDFGNGAGGNNVLIFTGTDTVTGYILPFLSFF